MKEKKQRDYSNLTIIASFCGLVPYTDRQGKIKEGFYTLSGLEAPVDLTACAENENAILRTALKQLSEKVDDSYHYMIERDFQD